MAAKAKWTILTYIAAHNNLEQMGKRSKDQIIGVGSTSTVMHGVLFDWPKGAARYIVGGPGKVVEQNLAASFDSGAPAGLIDTARWVFKRCPAEHYGLILWSHGSGWQPEEIQAVAKQARGGSILAAPESKERSRATGSRALFRTTIAQIVSPNDPLERAILFDDGTGHSLDTMELEKVTRAIQETIGQPLDLLSMDACLMATLEVAYQVRQSVRCLVASEGLVPGHSWPYDLIFADLREHPDRSAADLAAFIVQQYAGYYKAHPPASGDVTKVALNLDAIGELSGSVDALAKVLLPEIDNLADLLGRVQRQVRQKETFEDSRKQNKFQYHLYDIGSVAKRLGEVTKNQAVQATTATVLDALKPGGPTVLAEEHDGAWFEGIGGVSIYMMVPKTMARMSPAYAKLALSTDTAWYKLLCVYHAHYP